MFFFKNLKYKHYRKLQQKLGNMLAKEISKNDLMKAAKMLGILKNDFIILEDNGDSEIFQDFVMHDLYDKNGSNAFSRCLERNVNKLTEDEIKILNSSLNSRCSLFSVREVNRKDSTIELVDLLEDTKDIKIIDIGLSSNHIIKSFMIYTRILSIDNMNMTSGAPMLFENKTFNDLEQEYKKNLKKIKEKNKQIKNTIVFFKIRKKIGFPNVTLN